MIVRPARPTDLAWFAAFDTPDAPPWVAETEAWLREDAWAWWRSGERRTLVVAVIDGQVIGVGAAELIADDVAFVTVLLAHPDHWRSGVARRLLEHLITTFGSVAASAVWRVHELNRPAHLFSVAMGAWRNPVAPAGYVDYVLALSG